MENNKEVKSRNSIINNIIITFLFILLFIGSLNANGSKIGILSLGVVVGFTNVFYFLRVFYRRRMKLSDAIILFLTMFYIIVSLISSQIGLGNKGLTNTFEFVACIGVYLYFSSCDWNEKVIQSIYRISIIFVSLHFLVWIAQGLGRQFSSIYPNSNILGPFMFLAIYFILMRIFTISKRTIPYIFLLIALIILIASDTRSVLLSILVGVAIYLLWNKIIKFKIGSIITFLIIVIGFGSVVFLYPKLPRWSQYGKLESWMLEHTGKSIMSGRADIWGRLSNLIDLRPVFGFGPNTVATDVIGRNASSHNLYINMALQTGYLGLIIFIFILFTIFMKYVYRGQNKLVRLSAAGFIAILAHQLFEITLVQNQLSIGLFQWVVIATGAGITLKNYDVKKESEEISDEKEVAGI
ncbi:O-antigen ligase family protein [Staphylococcus haemolyticus]|uniref:O-antigen ligase family protein n=1 Tax=Staphylococcus haemolyticus TaxID=1283 RepID=UPI0028FECF2A|nr:O-antigen ligase family protein [Staphylococcus haemolyticus]MDU0444103.1 O-antigen ligase family protein [Staphylococcus haemolyticus]MDU0449041.1 O-antigen ligase family protein [Staphylococcus haemolyticus]MDU0485996.1 O-antigen ligase family protein [Staphylococcus haemolyticus]MDU0490457.1 O-antigen ligase family protein [Staphylococcus haemolyticus]